MPYTHTHCTPICICIRYHIIYTYIPTCKYIHIKSYTYLRAYIYIYIIYAHNTYTKHTHAYIHIYQHIHIYPYTHMHLYTYIRHIPITHHPQHLTENNEYSDPPITWKTYTREVKQTINGGIGRLLVSNSFAEIAWIINLRSSFMAGYLVCNHRRSRGL